jgi:hypothetical protein
LVESQTEERVNMLSGEKIQALLEFVAIPCAQLITQHYLHTEKGISVKPSDTFQITSRLVRDLEKAGLDPIGSPGQSLEFDPEFHTPLDASVELEIGSPVIVKFVGFRFQNTILLKAQVEAVKA